MYSGVGRLIEAVVQPRCEVVRMISAPDLRCGRFACASSALMGAQGCFEGGREVGACVAGRDGCLTSLAACSAGRLACRRLRVGRLFFGPLPGHADIGLCRGAVGEVAAQQSTSAGLHGLAWLWSVWRVHAASSLCQVHTVPALQTDITLLLLCQLFQSSADV